MNELTSGSTWHAAGNCPTFSGQLDGDEDAGLWGQALPPPLGRAGGRHRLSRHRLAPPRPPPRAHGRVPPRRGRWREAQGLALRAARPRAQARELYPFLETHDLEGALWDPLDGDVDPSQLTQAYARLAREAGCRIERFTRVTSLARGSAGEWLVGTDKGETIRAEIVVNAAGYRAGEIMALVGRHLPIVAMQHQYLVTEDVQALVERGAGEAAAAARPGRLLLSAPGAPGLHPRPLRVAVPRRMAGRHPGRLRLPALARRSRPARPLYRGRLRARADPGRGRRQARGQRPDPLRARRQSLYRPRRTG